MKKQYIKPAIRIPEMEMESLLASQSPRERVNTTRWSTKTIFNLTPLKTTDTYNGVVGSDINNETETVYSSDGLSDWDI